MTIQPGTDIGRYHILEQLGEGGMAVVYKAYDTKVEREVALKVIRMELKDQERHLKRFKREAKALTKLTHPNIVGLLDFDIYEGNPYIVMEYIPGGNLKERLAGPIPWQKVAALLVPIADALGYAHKQGILHRDVKPSNILITESGQPMLSDFGVAKVLEVEETMDLTATGMGVGTPEYMAPEQFTSRDYDHRADVYALGVVLYEMVVGRKPFTADTPYAVAIKQSKDPLPRPTNYVAEIPEDVERVLFKALAKDSKDRFADMGEMLDILKKLSTGGQISKKLLPYFGKIEGRDKKGNKKTRWLIGVVGLAIAAALLRPDRWVENLFREYEGATKVTDATEHASLQLEMTRVYETENATNQAQVVNIPTTTPNWLQNPILSALEIDILDHAYYYSAVVEEKDQNNADMIFNIDAGSFLDNSTFNLNLPSRIYNYFIVYGYSGISVNDSISLSGPPGSGLNSIKIDTVIEDFGGIYSQSLPAPPYPGVYTLTVNDKIIKFEFLGVPSRIIIASPTINLDGDHISSIEIEWLTSEEGIPISDRVLKEIINNFEIQIEGVGQVCDNYPQGLNRLYNSGKRDINEKIIYLECSTISINNINGFNISYEGKEGGSFLLRWSKKIN